jgi:hypothetical protein
MRELEKYDAACHAIAECKSVFEAKDWHNKAIGMEVYARAAKNEELEADAKAIRMHAIRRLGQMMKEQDETIGFNKGTSGRDFNPTHCGGVPKTPPSDNDKPTLASQDIDKNLAKKARQLRAMSDKEFGEMIANTRKPKPKKSKKPKKSPGIAARHERIVELSDQGLSRPDIANQVGIGERMVSRVLEVEEARREAEPDVDANTLSVNARKKLETAVRQHKRYLDGQFSRCVSERLKEVLDNWLPDYERKLREAEDVLNTYEGIMSRSDFRKIWACLHPDGGASKRMMTEAFDIFAKHEKVLVKKEKEQREPTMQFPRNYQEAMELKRKVSQERKAKRTARSGAIQRA